jgi:hypothetical protein
MKRLLFSGALAIVLATTSLAAAGKNSTSASIILNTPQSLAGSAVAWEPKLGDTVNFTTTYPSSLDRYAMYIQVRCYQNGSLVFATTGLTDRSFVLGGTVSPWRDSGGAATCNADLYYWSTNGQRYNQVATTEFNASGF